MNEDRDDPSDLASVPEHQPDYTATARCLGCGYALRDLPENRCPECGGKFDPADPLTMDVPLYKPLQRPATFGGTIIALACVTAVFSIIASRAGAVMVVIAPVAWAGILIAWMRRTRREKRGEVPADEAPWRRAVGAMLALTFIVSVRYVNCPHGITVGVGPVGIFYSGWNSPPCRNTPNNGGEEIGGGFYLAWLR